MTQKIQKCINFPQFLGLVSFVSYSDLTKKCRIFKRSNSKGRKLHGVKFIFRKCGGKLIWSKIWPKMTFIRATFSQVHPHPFFGHIPYFLILTIMGLFECEKRYLCSLNKIRPFKPFGPLGFMKIRLLFFQLFGLMVAAFCGFGLLCRCCV